MTASWTHSRSGAIRFLIAMIVLAGSGSASVAATPFVHGVVDTTGGIGYYSSLALDVYGNPRLSCASIATGDIVYATKSGGVWTFETVGPPDAGGSFSSLAVDGGDNPRVCYQGSGVGLVYAAKNGSIWTIETADGTGSVGHYPSLALDAEGNPRVGYRDATNTDVKYAAKNGSTWTRETVGDTGTLGSFTSLALDAYGSPRMTWYANTGADLMYASKSGSVWTVEIVDGAASVGQFASMVLDPQGNARVSYYDATNGDLKFATKNGSSWTIEVVDAAGNVGQWTSLRLDALGNPRVCYHDAGNLDLKFAARSGSAWTIEVLDALGNVGAHSSLALDVQGNPQIVYLDFTRTDLRFTDAAVHVRNPGGGVNWPVGSVQTIEWSGTGVVDVLLSVDGGNSFELLKDDQTRNRLTLRVPHTPTRFAQLRVSRSSPLSVAESDSFFTIDATIALAQFGAKRDEAGRGVSLKWETRPGPEADIRYRVERASTAGGAFSPIHTDLLAIGAFDDSAPLADSRYRLVAVNGLGEEYVLGETAVESELPGGRRLMVYPNPSQGGNAGVAFRVPFDPDRGAAGAAIDLSVYDTSGRRVRTLASGVHPAGAQSARWDGRDADGRPVPAGVYFMRLSSATRVEATERVVVVR